jgi:hypothetical protein
MSLKLLEKNVPCIIKTLAIFEHSHSLNKQGQRARLGVVRTKKQSAILTAYSHEKSALRRLAASKAGKFDLSHSEIKNMIFNF